LKKLALIARSPIVNPRLPHCDFANPSDDRALLVVTIANHKSASIGVDDSTPISKILADFGFNRCRKHLSGTLSEHIGQRIQFLNVTSNQR
jgi:hypothetical protein